MSTWRILVTVLLLIHPALSQRITTTCEIPSVEAGENTTLTIRFDHDLSQEEKLRDFYLDHIGHSSTATQTRLLDCDFSYGNVTCHKTSCCTWESHVTDVFRVYIHNVSQELEGRFWGFISPASTEYQKSCNFSLKAFSCPTSFINASNSQMTCSNHSVSIGQTCTVTCNPGYHFKENQYPITYTCVGQKKWYPNPLASCEPFSCPTNSINASNSQMTCSNLSVSIGQTCTVTCKPGYYFKENNNSLMYTCVGEKKWSPENPLASCEEQVKGQKTSNSHLQLLSILIPSVIAILILVSCVIFFIVYKRSQTRRKLRRISEVALSLVKMAQQEVTDYWLVCIRIWYTELQSQTYFLPPVHLNHGQDSEVRDVRALKRVLLCLRALADNSQETNNPHETDIPQETDRLQQPDIQQADNLQEEEVMMIISQLQFGNYIDQPSYAGAVALSSMNSKRSGLFQQHYDKGDCDVLIIHKSLGLLTLQITSVGETFSQQELTEQKTYKVVMTKVKEAVKQLNKAEADLKHLTSDMADIKHITKILVLPNITSNHLRRAIKRFPSDAKFLRECLGAKSVDDAMKLCLLQDQLSDYQTPSDINHSSLQALREWWKNVRVSRSGSSLTSSLYEQLVARFCGPATTVEVHCVTAPRLNITTIGEAVSETGERVARIVLFPQQVDILNQSPPQAFLSGPPGTGKTIVLIMQGLTWIRRGHDVHVVSTCDESRAATFVIEHQLQETAKTSTARSRVHRHQFDFWKDGDVETAVSCLKYLSEGKQLCVIADEVMRHFYDRKTFQEFCDKLIVEVSGVYIWGASVYNDVRPLCMDEVKLTIALRSPLVVVREVMEACEIKEYKQVDNYTVSDVSDVPDAIYGPPVRSLKHHFQSGHTGIMPHECVECGREVAHILTELNVGQTGDNNSPPPLQYRDVLVLCLNYSNEERVESSGLIRGLRDCHVPVRVVKDDDEDGIRDTALGVGDLVTVANWNDVQGLERKVVVVEGVGNMFHRLRAMSSCTSQLVVFDWLYFPALENLLRSEQPILIDWLWPE